MTHVSLSGGMGENRDKSVYKRPEAQKRTDHLQNSTCIGKAET